jgi:hypothetical protein
LKDIDNFPLKAGQNIDIAGPPWLAAVGIYGVTVRLAVFVTPAYEAEIVTIFFSDTTFVFTGKMAEVAPFSTVTLVGTIATFLLLASATTAPPAGAGPDNVTVPCEGIPPFTVVGFSVSEDKEMPV